MTPPLRVGTRSSLLARSQTGEVVAALAGRERRARFEVVPMPTQGDRSPTRIEGLDFTDAIDRALEDGRIDLAVHSAKDLPVRSARPVEIAAFPRRADPRDGLVLRGRSHLAGLPAGSVLGSSSPRRRAQVLRARPDLRVVDVRGNVDTRLRLVAEGHVDGVVLAVAGLTRIGRAAEVRQILPRTTFIPAPGQGALAIATRRADRTVRRLVARIDDPGTRAEVTAERSFVERMGGGCDTPLGASARVRAGRLTLRGEVLAPDGSRTVRGHATGPSFRAADVGRRLADLLRRRGAGDILEELAAA